MKLIINISDESYDKALNGIINCKECFDAIVYGTPIPDNATVCDIEQIRAEIERATIEMDYDTAKEALAVIDKYKGE